MMQLLCLSLVLICFGVEQKRLYRRRRNLSSHQEAPAVGLPALTVLFAVYTDAVVPPPPSQSLVQRWRGVQFKFFYLAKIIKIQSDLEAHRPFVWPFFFSFLPFLNDFFYDRPAWGGGEARI